MITGFDRKNISKEKIISGIYFLFKNNTVVYVGQSVNLVSRINGHAKEGTKDYDSYNYIESEINLDELESHYIAKYLPKYNKTIADKNRFIKIEHVKSRMPEYTFKLNGQIYIDLKKIADEFIWNGEELLHKFYFIK